MHYILRSKAFFLLMILATVIQFGCTSEDSLPQIRVDDSPLTFKTDTGLPGILNSDFFVFVGEKIEMKDVVPPDGEDWMDVAFDLKYRVIEQVYGNFAGDIIEFRAFDHYGIPPFSKAKYVMLFVVKEDGKLYHEKYQYYEVHRTTHGRWAACGDPYRYADEYHRKPFQPTILAFNNPVIYERGKLSRKDFEKLYPAPFFEISDDKAVCKMGAYTDDLFQVKRNGVLKARGISL